MGEELNLEPIKRRLALATPGKWECWPTDRGEFEPGDPDPEIEWEIGSKVWWQGDRPMSWDNVASEVYGPTAHFIAKAPKDVAALVAEVERLRHALAEVLDELDGMATQHLVAYGDDEYGHSFMSSDEACAEILVKYLPERWEATKVGIRLIPTRSPAPPVEAVFVDPDLSEGEA